MLGLGKHIGGDKTRIAGAVRNDQDLARPGDHVDVDAAENLFFRFRDEPVARADDLVDLRYGFGPERQRGDRLRAADLKDASNACDLCRGKDNGIDAAVRRRRRRHDDLAASRKDRGHAVHQHGRRICRRAARHVQTDFF